MGSRGTEIDGQPTADSTPEDVAVLYSWANLQGAKYRDYSASRREYRAQVRYRAAKALLERELRAQVAAEAAANEAERRVRTTETMADSQPGKSNDVARTWPDRSVQEAARQASAERVEAARRAESAARAAVLALREEREIAEAHSSAMRQAQVYEDSELLRRQLAGPQPHGLLSEGYGTGGQAGDLRTDGPGSLQQFLFSGWQESQRVEAHLHSTHDQEIEEPVQASASEREDAQNAPAWLFPPQSLPRTQVAPPIPQSFRGDVAGGDTLQDSRERVAARWFALKDVFDHAAPELAAMQSHRLRGDQRPILAVFSLGGGVGKTSLVATLGRALSVAGEKVVVADTTSQGLLPIYFGSDEVRAKTMRSLPQPDESEPAVSLAIHDFAAKAEDDRQRETLTEEVLRSGQGKQRLLIDLATGSSWLIRRLVDLHPTVLVPMAPDMNSVISLQATERLFRGIVDAEGRSLLPFYVLNQFDASLPLHLDVREVFRRQLGDRLLRFAIRRAPAVSEALAEGMTVLDYAPDAPVSLDYRDVAAWLRSVSPPATDEFRSVRWGEE